MSVPAVAPGRSFGHRIVSLVVRSPLGLRFGRNIASRVDPTLIRLTRGHVSSVWPFHAVVMTHVGAKSGGIRGRFLAEEIYDAERDFLFQRAKDAPGPYGSYEKAAAAKSRCVPVIAFTPQSCRCDTAVVNPAHRLVRFDDVIDAQRAGFVQCSPTLDHDTVNSQRSAVAIAERAAKRILAAGRHRE